MVIMKLHAILKNCLISWQGFTIPGFKLCLKCQDVYYGTDVPLVVTAVL
jgi:hypothetical protein